jgi:hypothetical protein
LFFLRQDNFGRSVGATSCLQLAVLGGLDCSAFSLRLHPHQPAERFICSHPDQTEYDGGAFETRRVSGLIVVFAMHMFPYFVAYRKP